MDRRMVRSVSSPSSAPWAVTREASGNSATAHSPLRLPEGLVEVAVGLTGQGSHCLLSADVETEACRGEMICSRPWSPVGT